MAGTLAMDAARAQAGLALLQKEEDAIDLDVAGATKFKEETEAHIATLEADAAALTGKEGKKQRTEIGKEISSIKNKLEYIDACKVVKGLAPKNGFFAKVTKAESAPTSNGTANGGYSPAEAPLAPAPVAEEKKEKKDKPKKVESTGLSRAERDELEKLKNDIITKKKDLKDSGLSGAACNKDEEVVKMVTRMQELKIKEDPSLADANNNKKAKDNGKKKKGALSTEEQAEFDKLQQELEQYRQKLATEFGYGKKDIANDPDFQEMQAQVLAFEKRA